MAARAGRGARPARGPAQGGTRRGAAALVKPAGAGGDAGRAWPSAEGVAFLEFGFGKGVGASHIILEQTAVAESEEELLATHGVPSSASKGVVEKARANAVHDEPAKEYRVLHLVA